MKYEYASKGYNNNQDTLIVTGAVAADADKVVSLLRKRPKNPPHTLILRESSLESFTLDADQLPDLGFFMLSLSGSRVGKLTVKQGGSCDIDIILYGSTVDAVDFDAPMTLAISNSDFPFRQAAGCLDQIAIGDGVPLLRPYLCGFTEYVHSPDFTDMMDAAAYKALVPTYRNTIFRAKLAMRQIGSRYISDSARL